MQSKSTRRIRSVGFSKINQLTRAARHLGVLRPAFSEWQEGGIYVCKKTGSYRYRFGDHSKSVAPWSAIAEKLFSSPAAFAFAAMVLGPSKRQPLTQSTPAPVAVVRVDVIQLAEAA